MCKFYIFSKKTKISKIFETKTKKGSAGNGGAAPFMGDRPLVYHPCFLRGGVGGGGPYKKVPKIVPEGGTPLCAIEKKGVADRGGYPPSGGGYPLWKKSRCGRR